MRNVDWNKEFPEVPDTVHSRVMDALGSLTEENGGGRQRETYAGQWGRERKAGKRDRRAGSRLPMAVAAAAAVFLVASGSCYAAWKYLSMRQVAEELADGKLAEAFESEAAVTANEVQEMGGYRITFMGAVAGKDISRFVVADDSGQVEDDKLYTVVTIEHVDGTPMPDVSSEEYGKAAFYVSPYIQGLNPVKYSIMSMGGGYSEFVKDGVQYRLVEVDNLEMFAGRELYLGVSSGTFYDPQAYLFNEGTGEIERREDYNGVNALFSLPLDTAKADPEAAKAYLEQLEASWEADDCETETGENDRGVEEWIKKVTPENIEEYADVIESTVKTYTPDARGTIEYSWETGSGAGGSGISNLEQLFPDGKAGRVISGYSYSEEGLADLKVETFTMNEDGTVTLAVYVPKEG